MKTENTIILKIENLSKQYRLGLVGTATISEDIKRLWSKLRGKEDPFLKVGEQNDRTQNLKSDFVWALKGVNFSVKEGEVLGIIGKNGAGKSTLLKILSRITLPTTGCVKSNGRIASLLEVGTGFHPELTGLENIYLNGAILGMTKKEIASKANEIIEFSGCKLYINTPVKRYSSGMRVRLAFAVAAFLEPDILVIDEVLAVGDAEFQKKAIGKMKSISNTKGRTVLFVSHNMASVKTLCTRAIVLEQGKLVFTGGTDKAVRYYLNGTNTVENRKEFKDIYVKDKFKLYSIAIANKDESSSQPILEDKIVEVVTELEILNTEKSKDYHVTYHLVNELGDTLFSFSSYLSGVKINNGYNKLSCQMSKGFLQSGQYYLTFIMVENKREVISMQKDIISFTVQDRKREIGSYMGREPGYIRPNFKWSNLND